MNTIFHFLKKAKKNEKTCTKSFGKKNKNLSQNCRNSQRAGFNSEKVILNIYFSKRRNLGKLLHFVINYLAILIVIPSKILG